MNNLNTDVIIFLYKLARKFITYGDNFNNGFFSKIIDFNNNYTLASRNDSFKNGAEYYVKLVNLKYKHIEFISTI